MVTIRKPMWNGGRRMVGIAERFTRYGGDTLKVEITYKDRKGWRIYPRPFVVSMSVVLRCQRQTTSGCPLFLVPLEAMREELEPVLRGSERSDD
jgi:hypothetical protein